MNKLAKCAGALLLSGAVQSQASAEPIEHHAPYPPLPSSLTTPQRVGDPNTRLSKRYSGAPIDVLTFHYDQNRTGWNQTETDLTAAAVASANFGLLTTLAVDGNVLAQPLLLSNFVMPDGSTHDVLVIATGHNSIYAFDAQNYTVLWQVNLGTAQASADVGCSNVLPEYGISSTPVAVRTGANAATLYVVAATEPSKGVFITKLHALNVATGADVLPAVPVVPTAVLSDGSKLVFNQKYQWSRAGLAYANGSIYIGIGSHCDFDQKKISGWLLRYSGSTLKLQHAFHTIETAGGSELASIWMTGFAPSVDASGNLFVVTGNGDFTQGKKDWGESVLKLPPSLLTVSTSLTAYAYNNLNLNDYDFGSGGVMLLPSVPGQVAPPLAVALGKSNKLYLLNQTSLGGLEPGDAGALQVQSVGPGAGLWGGPAYYSGADGPVVFTQSDQDVLRSWSVSTGSSPALTRSLTGTSIGGYGGSLPVVSSNGATPGSGVVWLINHAQNPLAIEAYDAAQLGSPLFSSQVGNWSNPNDGNAYLTAFEANGRVYAGGYLLVSVFGLAP